MTLIATLILSSSLLADPASGLAPGPTPKLTDLSWLAGSWRGALPDATSGSQIEEVWTPSAGGVMMGMFRMVNAKGQASFYEFQIIEETAEGVGLKIKHFNRAMKGQEEREKYADFKVTKATANEATFEAVEEDARVSLIYKLLPGGRLEVHFQKTVISTGKEQKMLFPFERVR